MSANINNLNIITFIKDIKISKKQIDQCLNTFRTDIDSRISKLEENYNTIQDKLINLEQIIIKMDNKLTDTSRIDKNIEAELFDQMYKLNKNTLEDTKLELKPKELTIANILENNYSIQDVNNSLNTYSDYKPVDLCDINTMDISNMNILDESKISTPKKNRETLDSILFG
jgi:hypothetical protein